MDKLETSLQHFKYFESLRIGAQKAQEAEPLVFNINLYLPKARMTPQTANRASPMALSLSDSMSMSAIKPHPTDRKEKKHSFSVSTFTKSIGTICPCITFKTEGVTTVTS